MKDLFMNEVVEKLNNKDRHVWDWYYNYWNTRFRMIVSGRLQAACRRKGLDHAQEVLDCAQEIWVVVWEKISGGQVLSRSYLSKIAKTRADNYARSLDNNLTDFPLEYIEREGDKHTLRIRYEAAVDDQRNQEARSELEDIRERFGAQLSITERRVFHAMLEDKDDQEIADELDLGPTYARVLKHRIRRKLEDFKSSTVWRVK
jgi:DNA-directed RNA polymerase specialized sigma24 family protein